MYDTYDGFDWPERGSDSRRTGKEEEDEEEEGIHEEERSCQERGERRRIDRNDRARTPAHV